MYNILKAITLFHYVYYNLKFEMVQILTPVKTTAGNLILTVNIRRMRNQNIFFMIYSQ